MSVSQRPAVVPAGQRAKRPSTVRDMLLSLLVVGAAAGMFILLQPRSHHQKVTPVEYLPAAQALAKSSSLPVYAPDPLPPGWQANYVRIGNAPDQLHVGFVLHESRFAQLDESAQPDAAFYRSAAVSPTATAMDPADAKAGVPSGFEVRRSKGHVALLRHLPGGAVLTISDGATSGGASLDQLVGLANSLRQQH